MNVGVIDPCEDEQRRGRGDRDRLGGLHLIMYESWVKDIKLGDFDNTDSSFAADPDRPRTLLKKGSNKRDRLPRSGLETILAPCVREYRAKYFGNDSSSCRLSTQ